MNLWIMGRLNTEYGWEFMGIFSTEVLARDACSTPKDFIGPATLDMKVPNETIPWPGSYYPLRKD